jgi:hypothetical protein
VIKYIGTAQSGRSVIAVGLSRENIELLLAGREIAIDVDDMAAESHRLPPAGGWFRIFAAETDDELMEKVASITRGASTAKPYDSTKDQP